MPQTISRSPLESPSGEPRRHIYQFFDKVPLSNAQDLEALLTGPLFVTTEREQDLRPLLLPLNTTKLLKTNPALFHYLSPLQRKSLLSDLRITFYTLCMRYKIDSIEHRRQNQHSDFTNIEHCAFLIRQLQHIQHYHDLEMKKTSAQTTLLSKTHWYQDKINAIQTLMRDFSAGKTIYLRQWMADFNTWRLYWVWAGNLLRMSLTLMPTNFFNVEHATLVATAPQPVLGYISWILYYTRFLVNSLLVLKHTVRGSWMSEAEKKLIQEKGGTWPRFKEQLALRKLTLLNDILWGTSNALCFFYLVGPTLGPIADLTTTILLLADASLSAWARADAKKGHQQELKHYDEEIQRLNSKLSTLKTKAITHPNMRNTKKIEVMEHQILRLEEAKQQCEFNWALQSHKLNADLSYSAGLLVAFAVMVFPWGEFAASATATGLAMAGAGACFALSLIYSGYKLYIDVQKSRATQLSALQQCRDILMVDGKLSEADFIRYRDLTAEANYQSNLADYQRYIFIRTVIIQSLIPFAIFSAFTFASFGIAAAICAAGIAIALITHYVIEECKPKEAALTQFDQSEYDAFNQTEEAQRIACQIEEANTYSVARFFSSKRDSDNQDMAPSPQRK